MRYIITRVALSDVLSIRAARSQTLHAIVFVRLRHNITSRILAIVSIPLIRANLVRIHLLALTLAIDRAVLKGVESCGARGSVAADEVSELGQDAQLQLQLYAVYEDLDAFLI
jgi:hypothetical protein